LAAKSKPNIQLIDFTPHYHDMNHLIDEGGDESRERVLTDDELKAIWNVPQNSQFSSIFGIICH